MKIYFAFSKSYAVVLCLFLLVAFFFLSVASSNLPKITLENEGQRVSFLEQHGFSVGDPFSIKTVTVPLDFDSEYKKISNSLLFCGYDINNYKGRNLTEYTYYLENNIMIHLIMDNEILVGANCVNLKSGSIHPLAGE